MPVAEHKRVQSNSLYPQHGGVMTSMHKVYCKVVLSSTSALSTKLPTKQQFWANTCRQRRQRFCFVDLYNSVLFWKRKDTFTKQNIYKISLQKGLNVCEKRCQASAAACLTLSLSLFTRPVPMIHRVLTQSLDFGLNITAFISWPLFCRQLSPSGWNLTRHVDKEICPRRQHYCKVILVDIDTKMLIVNFFFGGGGTNGTLCALPSRLSNIWQRQLVPLNCPPYPGPLVVVVAGVALFPPPSVAGGGGGGSSSSSCSPQHPPTSGCWTHPGRLWHSSSKIVMWQSYCSSVSFIWEEAHFSSPLHQHAEKNVQ